ncbi:MAG: hypothetical protein HY744_30820 [Deltaproteobacteria bacterium]|nr:hypothetical protein [Deltaproteobacteria bacterium]
MSAASKPRVAGGPGAGPLPRVQAAATAALLAGFFGCALPRSGTGELECATSAECPAEPPCRLGACSAEGRCELASAPDGPMPDGEQTAGDCQRRECAAGEEQVVPDPSDAPPTEEQCKPWVCPAEGGAAAPDPGAAEGLPCTSGKGHGYCHDGACAADCPPEESCDDENGCTADACDLAVGKCVNKKLVWQLPPGVPQVPGDCRIEWCDEDGAQTDLPDDGDKPDDKNECTEDDCNAGVPVEVPKPLGTPCKQSGGRVCNGNPQNPLCVKCNVPSDCVELPQDNECRQRACISNTCILVYQPQGTPFILQTDHDCKLVVCDGQGATEEAADDADLPDDGNDCTADSCSGGKPQHAVLANGAACGQSLAFECLGGKCGCGVPGDCLGADDDCRTRTCAKGLCGWAYAAHGKHVSKQIPADCQDKICDGQGNVISIVNDGDIQDDGLECTEDLCAGGAVQHPSKVLNAPCAGKTKYCDGKGACVDCNSPDQCPAGKPCETATCTGNKCALESTPEGALAPPNVQSAKDCKKVTCDGKGGTSVLADPTDLPDDGKQCTKNECSLADPSFPPKDVDTACDESKGHYCNGLGACVECTKNVHCQAPSVCEGGLCGCTPKTCWQLGLSCGLGDNGCGGSVNCNNGIKDGTETDIDCGGNQGPCPTRCGDDKACQVQADCAPGLYCDPGTLKCTGKLLNGKNCAGVAECKSGFCVDGYCCDKACGGACDACNLPGKQGTCTPLAKDTECRASAGACDVAEKCDGVSGICPSDTVKVKDTECRAAADACDVAEKCDGVAKACPGDAVKVKDTECRAAADACDVTEKCDGVGKACPGDAVKVKDTECRAAAGACDVAEACDGVGKACPGDAVKVKDTECRAAAGACDVAEACDGVGKACPGDAVKVKDTECRAAAGACDVAEACDGVGKACPSDGFKANDVECRALAGDCDVAEKCPGNGPACPSDGFKANDVVCRVVAGDCDAEESCPGNGKDCPADGFLADGQPSTGGGCDPYLCDGLAATCPSACAGDPDCVPSYSCRSSQCVPPGAQLWSKAFGGASIGYSVAVDGSGSALVTGSFDGTVDFGGGPLTSAGGYDIFVAKLDNAGGHLWSKSFGDASGQGGWAIAADGSGNVLVTGGFAGAVDFGGGPLTSAGGGDIFVAKLDPSGNPVWQPRVEQAFRRRRRTGGPRHRGRRLGQRARDGLRLRHGGLRRRAADERW